MNKYVTATVSSVIALILFVILGAVIGKVQSDLGDFVFLVVLLFPPMFILSICQGFIFKRLFTNWTSTSKIVRTFVALIISSAISISYLMITWAMFGNFTQLVQESMGIMLISIAVVTLTEALIKRQPELVVE